MARTESQKLAVATIRKAAKALIAEVDRYDDPRHSEFMAHFHLERWRVESISVPGQTWTHMRHGLPIYRFSSAVLKT